MIYLTAVKGKQRTAIDDGNRETDRTLSGVSTIVSDSIKRYVEDNVVPEFDNGDVEWPIMRVIEFMSCTHKLGLHDAMNAAKRSIEMRYQIDNAKTLYAITSTK